MLGLFKKLFRKREADIPPAASAPLSFPPPDAPQGIPSAPVATAISSAHTAQIPKVASIVPVAPIPTAPIPAAFPAPTRSRGKMERVLISLRGITDLFPQELQAILIQAPAPHVMIALPVDGIVEQLSSGKARVSIHDLKRVAPAAIFSEDPAFDDHLVEIPLQELLLKLDHSLLKRRTQRIIELPKTGDVFIRRDDGSAVIASEAEQEIAGEPVEELAEEPLSEEQSFSEEAVEEAAIPYAQAQEEETAPNLESAGLKLALSDDPAPLSEEPALSVHPEPPVAAATLAATPTEEGILKPPADWGALFGKKEAAPAPEAPAVVVPPAPAAPAPTPVPPAPVVPSVPPAPAAISLKLSGTPAPAAPAAKVIPPVSPAPPVVPSVPTAPPPKAPAPISLKVSKPQATPAVPTTPAIPVAAAPAPVVPLAPAPAAAEAKTILVPLRDLATIWPEAIREEVAALPEETEIAFPEPDLAAILKRGKATLPWKQLRAWFSPAPAQIAPSLYEEAQLELSLPVVAPLFMAASTGKTAPKRRTEVDESIPAPFAPAAQRAAEEPTPVVVTAAPAEKQGEIGLDDDIPSQLVERACSLSGVAGSVIALKDGLLVAAKIPSEFQAETIAAFLPQVFSRVESAAGSMQIGEFQTLMFTAGDRSWQIWKAGAVFFAAMGRPHELLPSAQLKIIAGQLARQTHG